MPGRSSPIKTFKEDDRRIEVRTGDRFVIELSGIPGAGYQWSLSPGRLAGLVEREVLPSAGIGGAAAYRFHLEAKAAGTDRVTAEYRRAWEPQPHQVVVFDITIAE
jgi:predicted secreted protein